MKVAATKRNTSLVPPRRDRTLELPDGRRLAWHEWGDEHDPAVLFCTGAAMSGRMGFGADALTRLGLRLIAVDRPGLGASDPHPDKTLGSWTKDTRTLLATFGARRAGAVGFSQGAPFALALAATGTVQGVALVSAQDKLTHAALRPRLHPDVAVMLTAVERDPARFEAEFAAFATADGLWQLILGMSADVDRRLYSSDAFGVRYRACLDEGFRHGAAAYARDLVNALAPWPFAVEDIAVPVDLWYGALDTSTVHSPDFGATLASRLSRSTRHVEPAEGGSLLWTRADDVLDTLLERLRESERR